MKEEKLTAVAPDAIDDRPQIVKADLRKFSKADANVNAAITALHAIVITDQESVDVAMDVLKSANEVAKMIEKKRVELVTPFNDAVKKINDYAKRTLLKKLEDKIASAKQLVIEWKKKERERVIEDRKLQLTEMGFQQKTGGWIHLKYASVICYDHSISGADDKTWKSLMELFSEQIRVLNSETSQKLQSQLQDVEDFGTAGEAEELKSQLDDLKVEPKMTMSTPGSSAGSVKGMTKRWTFSILNASEVPTEYLTVDEAKIRKAIAEGVREIAGVKIFQEDGLSLR